jgi:uncharacterized delta-60 repeat protein
MADNFWKVRHGLTIGSRASDPSNPINGDIYYNSTRNVYRKYEAGAWFDVASNQDSSTILIEGGNWAWSDATDTLSWSADAYIQVPGLAKTRNEINVGSVSLAADGDIAYVDINRTTGVAATLTVSTGAIASVEDRVGRVVIARRIGNSIYVGPQGMLLEDGESKLLGKGGFTTTEFTVANNVASPANVTGFLVDSATNKGFHAEAWVSRYHLTADVGAADQTFNYNVVGNGLDNGVLANKSLAVQPDGKILVGGDFTTYDGSAAPDYLLRLNTDGTLDTGFNSGGSGPNGVIHTIGLQSDGKIIIGGSFTQYNGVDVPDRLIRLNTDGSWDSSFNSGGAGLDNVVRTLKVQPDDKVVIGGDFTTYNGVAVPQFLVRVTASGAVDSGFNSGGAGLDNSAYTFGMQSDDKIIVGGLFTQYNGVDVPDGLIRLNTNGSWDSAFNSGGSGFGTFNEIFSVAVQSDDQVVVGGNFTTYNGAAVPARLVRVSASGAIDAGFNTGGAGASAKIWQVVIQSDGKIVIGGDFTTYNAVAPARLTRLNTDGTVDTGFNTGGAGFNLRVTALALQADGKIIAAGDFTQYNGSSLIPDRIARILDAATNIDLNQQVTIRGVYSSRDLVWYIDAGEYFGDDVGLTFTMTSGGQLQYTSTDLSSYGTAQISKMRFIIMGL